MPTLESKRYHCGTLTYTTRGLLVLFAWLLWGDFCFTLMETVVPAILPLKLKALGAPNWLMAFIMSTLPGILNMTICPWVSFKSDRYRSKWGRRIPFILGTLPMLCLSLVALGWTDVIAALAQRWLPLALHVAPVTLTIVLLALFMVCFTFFNMFVGSVFWYLFNDVVPAEFFGRFYGSFRMVGMSASVLFNLFIFQHAETHMREIFTGAALLYCFGFGIVCLRVKEGGYPPPPEAPPGSPFTRLVGEVRSFSRECFSHRFYWLLYAMNAFGSVAGAVYMFNIFFLRDMGLDLKQIGIYGAVGQVASVVAMYVTAIYVDRWHPLRITTYCALFSAITTVYGNWIWLPVTVPAIMFFWLNIGGTVTQVFGQNLSANAGLPLFMRLMPSSRYGQFCSAAALIRSAGGTISGLFAGAFLDWLKWLYDGSDFAYRFIFVWVSLFSIVTAVFVFKLYREWKRMGGDEGYRAPAPWNPSGFEDMSDKCRPVKVHRRWLMVALHLFTAGFTVYLLSIPVFLILFQRHGLDRAFWWFAWVFTPLAFLVTAGWIAQVRSIQRDIATEAGGGSLRYGIPHHGVLMVMAIQGLLILPLLWLQFGWTLRLGMERELIWFGVGALTTLAPNLLVLHVLRLLERQPVGFPGDAVVFT